MHVPMECAQHLTRVPVTWDGEDQHAPLVSVSFTVNVENTDSVL